jgi:hypothetical protein
MLVSVSFFNELATKKRNYARNSFFNKRGETMLMIS